MTRQSDSVGEREINAGLLTFTSQSQQNSVVKKGARLVGLAPQYCRTVGKVANCQIGVFLAYATRHGRVLLDRALHLPKEWADAPVRRAEVGCQQQPPAFPNRR